MPTAAPVPSAVLSRATASSASGVLNASRQLGGALAIAVFGVLTTAFGNFLTGLRTSLIISAVLLLLTMLAATALPSTAPATGSRSSSGR